MKCQRATSALDLPIFIPLYSKQNSRPMLRIKNTHGWKAKYYFNLELCNLFVLKVVYVIANQRLETKKINLIMV